MTRAEQKRFIRELIGSVQKTLLDNVSKVPAEWDGHEIRQWIADKFQESSYTLKQNKSRYLLPVLLIDGVPHSRAEADRRGIHEYQNTVAVSNL
jgi:hypothetical protein